jgi:predicted acyl esterase
MLAERKQEMTATEQPGITGVQEEDMVVPARDGYQIPIGVYKPETSLAGIAR